MTAAAAQSTDPIDQTDGATLTAARTIAGPLRQPSGAIGVRLVGPAQMPKSRPDPLTTGVDVPARGAQLRARGVQSLGVGILDVVISTIAVGPVVIPSAPRGCRVVPLSALRTRLTTRPEACTDRPATARVRLQRQASSTDHPPTPPGLTFLVLAVLAPSEAPALYLDVQGDPPGCLRRRLDMATPVPSGRITTSG